MKTAILFSLLIIGFFVMDKACHRGSSVLSERISGTLNDPRWEVSAPEREELKNIREILDQKFFAIGKGAQFHAFVSEDQNYVLKCIKFKKFDSSSWLAHIPIPNPYRENYQNKQKKLTGILKSCKTAYLGAKEETGILFLHLNQTHALFPKVSIEDSKGNSFLIDLDATAFIIQKKAELVFPRIERFMKAGETEKAKEAISEVFKCLVLLGEKYVCENDPIISKNFGFLEDGTAIQIDIGQFQIQPHRKKQYKKELQQITASFRDWLNDNHPELCPHYDTVLQASKLGQI